MSISTTSQRIIRLIAWLVVLHVLLAYGLVEWLFVSMVILLGILFYRIGALGAVTVSLTLVAATLAYSLVLTITGFEDRIYHRPDEKYDHFDYANNHRIYRKNVRTEMSVSNGDMRSMTVEDIDDPRRIEFRTDMDGFRNNREYHGQRYLLVGDSFVAGNGNSQEDLLVAQLERDHGYDTYSLAHRGNVADYAAYVHGFGKRYGGDVRVLLFLFEGNDFEESLGHKPGALARNGRRYYEMFSGVNTYRVTMSLFKRFARGRDIRAGNALEIAELGGKKIAFYKPYVDITRRTHWPEPEGFEQAIGSIRPYIERIYFIPTKYRVYSNYVKPGEILPNAQWVYLSGVCQKFALHCTDLTPSLVRESANLLKRGAYTWWRDDTHWNRNGIAVAARQVASDLAGSRARNNSAD